jgi:hypothetical protein
MSDDANTSYPGDLSDQPQGGMSGGSDGGYSFQQPDSYDGGSSQATETPAPEGSAFPLSDIEKESAWTIGAHVVGELFDSTPIGIALHTVTMESDNPQAMEAQREEEFNQQLQDQTDAAREAQMTDSLQSHTVPMDAPAEREQDEEVFQP